MEIWKKLYFLVQNNEINHPNLIWPGPFLSPIKFYSSCNKTQLCLFGISFFKMILLISTSQPMKLRKSFDTLTIPACISNLFRVRIAFDGFLSKIMEFKERNVSKYKRRSRWEKKQNIAQCFAYWMARVYLQTLQRGLRYGMRNRRLIRMNNGQFVSRFDTKRKTAPRVPSESYRSVSQYKLQLPALMLHRTHHWDNSRCTRDKTPKCDSQ